jgi:hypothetical protein
VKPWWIAPIGIVGGLASLSAASLAAGLTLRDGRWWEAAVHLAVLSGLLPMIFAVNHRIVPVFSRRKWQSDSLWFVLIVAALASGVLSAVGIKERELWFERGGAALALAAGVLFLQQLGQLFRQPVTGPPPPMPYDGQRDADRVAIMFSRMAGLYLIAGLVIGLVTAFSTPDRGRWELVWAHMLLLGFVVSMASSVTYHVLTRWTPGRWRTPRLIPVHFVLAAIATLAMVVALATDQSWLFKVGGPTQAIALLIWGINCAPLLVQLPSVTREGMMLAFGFLAIGVSLGAAFAIDAHFGPIYRQVHAEFNVFGWAGFLILGAASYLVPRFAGSQMVWGNLYRLQFPAMALSLFVGGAFRRMQNDGRGDYQIWIELTHAIIAVALASFALQVALTFRARPSAPVLLTPTPRPQPGQAPPKPQSQLQRAV